MERYEMTSNPFSLHGQVALITGGGTGIGLAIAQAFTAQGARVLISGRREDVLQRAVKELENAPLIACTTLPRPNEPRN